MSYRMFNREIFRAIKGSFGRFIAITLIVALGCGFYAGLKTTAPDMNLSADAYYDETQLMDIRVVATLGMTEDDVNDIRSLDGIEEATAAYETDVMADIGSDQYSVRVHSLTESVNELGVAEGRLPEKEGECVISADKVMGAPAQIGETVQITEQTTEDSLATDKFTVVGFVHSPYYVSSVSMGSTSLGDGSIDQYMYVTEDSFDSDFPITEVFIEVAGAKAEKSSSEAYQGLVDEVVSNINGIAETCEIRRVNDIRADAQEELDEAREKFEKKRAKAQNKLDDAKDELDSANSQIATNEKKLEDAKAEYEQGLADFKAAKKKSEDEIADAEKQIEQGESELEAAKTDLATQKAQFEASKAYLPAETVSATEAALAKAQAQIDAEEKNLTQAKSTLKAEKKKAKAKLAAAQDELDSAKEEISSGEAQLEDAKAQYEDGLKEYEESKAEADAKLAKAEKKIDDAQEKVDDLDDLENEWLVLDRTKNQGVESFKSDAERVGNIAQIFPLIFFLVAALVALTTMTRMVDEDRMLIGTFKALGYSRAKITSKYMFYAFAASCIGAVFGIIVLSVVLPAVIMEAYAIIYYVPHSLIMPLDLPISAFSAILGIAITILATWFACASTLRETPAALMLPRAPSSGKTILLERVKPLWRHLSFLWKVTFRNIFRYKKRFFMTIIGIAGCTALLLTGLGLQDSINDIIDKQFGITVNYNVVVTFEDEQDAKDSGSDVQALLDTSTFAQDTSICPVGSDDESYYATLIVPQDPDKFQDFWLLRERVGAKQLAFGGGAIINEKLATSMGLSVGDEIVLADQDDMGNASNDRRTVHVDGIMENYIADYVFMTPDAYEAAFEEEPEFTSIFGVGDAGSSDHEELSSALHDVPGVKTVAFNDETIDTYKTMLRSVSMIVVVLVVSAAALAFIVLYNLTNINITERQREIATLKVLGFTRKEVYLYIFREMLLLTILGAIFGLIFGVFLEGFVVVTAEVDHVMFGREIHLASYIWGFLLTVVFSLIVMIFMGRRLDKIDMVESLKSIE